MIECAFKFESLFKIALYNENELKPTTMTKIKARKLKQMTKTKNET